MPQIKGLRPIRYANWWNVFGAGTEEKMVEKIPVRTLVDAFFDLTRLTRKQSLNADELTGPLNQLPFQSQAGDAALDPAGRHRSKRSAQQDLRLL
jgi:hypothetical protein